MSRATDRRPGRRLPPSRAPALALFAALGLAGLLALSVAGCATAPPPDTRMAVAEAAVARASTLSTSEAAPVELRLATSKLAEARAALAADPLRAARLAEQATVDAQVAELHAQAVRSRRAAQESEDAARALREEVARQSNR
ncbi:MAG: DUF4398 domain-containing protein [Rubrivivax sp.]|nr:DUF4398 domain-containing protein [Rubrivivax sp.]